MRLHFLGLLHPPHPPFHTHTHTHTLNFSFPGAFAREIKHQSILEIRFSLVSSLFFLYALRLSLLFRVMAGSLKRIDKASSVLALLKSSRLYGAV